MKPSRSGATPVWRCAIYTRKSTEDGLDQEFNSLDAQREACAAFIRSQRSEGWVTVPAAYDDGGVSGGTLERSALQRLLDDIREGRVDIVVVYKIAASRAQGLWTGGPVPFGYDAVDRRLVVNGAAAKEVRWIFETYLEAGSIRDLHAAVGTRVVDQQRAGQGGAARALSRGALANMLDNPIYNGEVRHRDRTYPGRHDPIVDHALWDRVQALRDANRRARRMRIGSRHPSPLAGMIHDETGQPLTPSHASKGGVRYRYYVSHSLVTRRAEDHPGAWRLAAEPVERAARNALAKLLRGRDVARALTKGASPGPCRSPSSPPTFERQSWRAGIRPMSHHRCSEGSTTFRVIGPSSGASSASTRLPDLRHASHAVGSSDVPNREIQRCDPHIRRLKSPNSPVCDQHAL